MNFDMPANKTLDQKGKKSVTIGDCGKDRTRVTVVLCCSANGDKLTPLIIHHSEAQYILNKLHRKDVRINRFSLLHRSKKLRSSRPRPSKAGESDLTVTDENGRPVPLWTSGNKTAWMNSKIMCHWLRSVFAPSHRSSTLIMDNFSGHSTDAALEEAAKCGVNVEFLPPNTTPVIQPLDHSLNASFKIAVRTLWKDWKTNTPPTYTEAGNRKGPSKELLEKWIMMAWNAISVDQVQRCWNHTLLNPTLLIAAKARLQARRERGQADIVLPTPKIGRVDEEDVPLRSKNQNSTEQESEPQEEFKMSEESQEYIDDE